MDRRSFLKSGILLPSVALLPPHRVSGQRNGPSLDRCFMAWDQHLDEVGERQALTDLRLDMFPITTQRRLATDNEYDFESAIQGIAQRYRTSHHEDSEDHSIKTHCSLITLPTQGMRIRDWWLVLRTTAVRTDVRAARVIFVTSYDKEIPASMNRWLTARINHRLQHRWNQMTDRPCDHTALTQEVNRQVIVAMRGKTPFIG